MTTATADPTRLAAVRVLRAGRGRQKPSQPCRTGAAHRDPTPHHPGHPADLRRHQRRDRAEPDRRDIVTTPPRTGKSRAAVAVWAWSGR